MNVGVNLFTSRFIGLSLICFVLFGGASAADGITKRRVSTAARLGRPFTLRAGRMIALRGQSLRIKFAEVTTDSRCPVDVKCVWAGNAAVRLEVSTDVPYGTQEADISRRSQWSLTLNTRSGQAFPSDAEYEGFKVTLMDLSPTRRSDRQVAPGDYVVTLLVTKE